MISDNSVLPFRFGLRDELVFYDSEEGWLTGWMASLLVRRLNDRKVERLSG